MNERPTGAGAVAIHRRAGGGFRAAGVDSFVRSEGDGDPVVLLHGLPASSFTYRKVIVELAARGLRGVAFDLPGLGLAERPEDFDYSIPGLGAFASAAVDELDLDRFHLVVHDAGGPVGFELANNRPNRIRSLTLLNTVVEIGPGLFPGEILARLGQGVGRVLSSPRVWRALMYRVGILDRTAVTDADVDAYRELALRDDRGAAYRQIMRALHDQRSRGRDYGGVLRASATPYPVQVIWGAEDPILALRRYGWRALRSTGLSSLSALPARHFLQEDQAPAVAELITRFADPERGRPPAMPGGRSTVVTVASQPSIRPHQNRNKGVRS